MKQRSWLAVLICVLMASAVYAQGTQQNGFELDMSFAANGKLDHNPDDPEPPDEEEDPDPEIYDHPFPAETRHIVYIIDASCSMSSQWQTYVDENGNLVTGNRMDRAKSEVIASINALPATFKFDIVKFVCGQSACFSELREATEGNKLAAASWVGSLMPSGATGTGPAVAWALNLPGYDECKTYLVVTDGAPNCMGSSGGYASWQTHLSTITGANGKGATIHGVNISPSTAAQISFVQGIASQNGPGAYVQID